MAPGSRSLLPDVALLTATGLSKSFDGLRVLDGVDVEVRAGEIVLLLGANGSGKTTLLNILSGNLAADCGAVAFRGNGAVIQSDLSQPWWRRLGRLPRFTAAVLARAGMGRSWQDIRLFESLSVADNLALAAGGPLNESLGRTIARPLAVQKADQHVREMVAAEVARLDLAHKAESLAADLSVGEGRRAAILRAMMTQARLVFLDEPLSGLDWHGVCGTVSVMQHAAKRGMALVIVEHPLNILPLLPLVGRGWVLSDGRVQVVTPDELSRVVDSAAASAVDGWLRGLGVRPDPAAVLPFPGGARLRVFRNSSLDSTEVVLRVQDLTLARRGMRVVEGLEFELRRGDVGVLEAPNGWGKTTLVQTLAGTLAAAAGDIEINGRDVSGTPAHIRSTSVSLFRSPARGFPSLSVREMLRLAAVAEPPAAVAALVGRNVGDLSSGERNLLTAVCSLSEGPKPVILLDEPFNALDDRALRALQGLVRLHAEAGCVLMAIPSLRTPSEREN